jgi:hypothetical protein
MVLVNFNRKTMENISEKIKEQFIALPVQNLDHIELTEPEMKSAVYAAIKKKYVYLPEGHEPFSAEELAEIYREAKVKKQGEINLAVYMKNLMNKPNKAPLLTAEQTFDKLLSWLKVNTGEVNLEEGRKDIYFQLCLYFTNDARFEGDLTKSLLLQGGIGTGKTTAMTFFQKNQKQNFKLIRTRSVAYEFKSNGISAIEIHSKNNGDTGFCFDDLGTESTLKNYGDSLNVMTEILLNRYDDKLSPTHITTNITVQQIKEHYGERLFDRMKEMFNQITFPCDAKSLRK